METISPVYARLVLRELERRDIDAGPLFAGTPLTRQELLRGGDLRMEDFLHILRAGQRLTGDNQLGLMLGRTANVLALGAVGSAAAVAPSIREGLQVLDSYTRLHASYIRIRGLSGLNGMRIYMRYAEDPQELRRFHTETGLMVLQQYVEAVSAGPLDGLVFYLDFPEPDYVAEYASCLRGNLVFDAPEASLEIPRHYLDLPSPYYNAQLWQEAQADLAQRLKSLADGENQPYTAHIVSLLRTSEPPLPDLAAVARGLHTSERTLNRRLQAEGSSFRALKSDALATWGKLYLAHTDQSVESIAAALGYQDAANFRRAFRKSVGRSPNDYRQHCE